MGRISFAQSLSDARLMADAIKAHETELKAVGLPEDTIEVLEGCIKAMSDLDTKQEKLKADLKATTASLDAKSAELSQVMQSARGRVKIAIPKEIWKEFGISATR